MTILFFFFYKQNFEKSDHNKFTLGVHIIAGIKTNVFTSGHLQHLVYLQCL